MRKNPFLLHHAAEWEARQTAWINTPPSRAYKRYDGKNFHGKPANATKTMHVNADGKNKLIETHTSYLPFSGWTTENLWTTSEFRYQIASDSKDPNCMTVDPQLGLNGEKGRRNTQHKHCSISVAFLMAQLKPLLVR